MNEPLIAPENRSSGEQIPIRLKQNIARELRGYAEYIGGSSYQHIISEALIRTFKADKGFASYKTANPNYGQNSALRQRGRAKVKRAVAAQ